MKLQSFIISASLLTLTCPAFGEDKPTPPTLATGKGYHIRTWDQEKKVCSPNWTPVKVLGFSERGDLIELELVNVRTENNKAWLINDAICDAQGLRSDGEKGKK